jgi:exopolysaccharide biosynthesis predicted pyruvyltransferase EpsI
MRTTNTIYAIGAFDRFNYGDLLFPIISKNFIEKNYPGTRFDSYALSCSDFSRFGALETKQISQLYRRGGVRDGDVIYFCGGGILGADWLSMHANLLGDFGNSAIYYLSRVLGYRLANNLSQFYFGAKSEFPWIASAEDFSAQVKIIYNAAGGSELSALAADVRDRALEKLSAATFLSVRDAETKRICASFERRIAVSLVPDSAVLMSEQFPRSVLESKVGAELKSVVARGKYVCFQANYQYVQKNFREIIVQLEKLHRDYGVRVLLLPIGRYVGLDDHKGLMELKNSIKVPVDIVGDNATIWDIMYSIAAASLFVGTSLHGNVTAQSFAVPHIGLSDRRSKLDFYLETWDIPEQAFCPKLEDINQVAGVTLAVTESRRLGKRDYLMGLAKQNLHNIMEAALS